jgi:hypothetical protein
MHQKGSMSTMSSIGFSCVSHWLGIQKERRVGFEVAVLLSAKAASVLAIEDYRVGLVL